MEIETLVEDNTISMVIKKGKNPHLGKSKQMWDDGTFKMCYVSTRGRNHVPSAS